jgi:hypothetical protein
VVVNIPPFHGACITRLLNAWSNTGKESVLRTIWFRERL